jgi:hypothetical protein
MSRTDHAIPADQKISQPQPDTLPSLNCAPRRTNRYNRTAPDARFGEVIVQAIDNPDRPRHWLTTVLTDVHFWVPVAVLVGGLLLLESIH